MNGTSIDFVDFEIMRQLIFGIFIIGIFFTTCHKEPPFIEEDPPEWVPDSCDINIPGHISVWGVSFTKQFPFYNYPSYNPNNPDEIVFREEWLIDTLINDTLYDVIHGGLVKYNMATGDKELIYDGLVGPSPRWSRKGWILLFLPDYKIYKIKSNGDSLTQLTFEGTCLGPEWNKAGDQFVYSLISEDGNLAVFCDENGNEIFRNNGGTDSPSWQHDSLLTHLSAYALRVWHPETLEILFLHESNKGGASGAEWLDSEKII